MSARGIECHNGIIHISKVVLRVDNEEVITSSSGIHSPIRLKISSIYYDAQTGELVFDVADKS